MIKGKQTVSVGIVILLTASIVTGGIATSAAAGSENVRISNVTISPDTPAPGEPFEVTATIENLEGGSGSVDITDIYIRDSTGLPEYERVDNAGSVGEGQSMEVPLQLSVSNSKNLRVHVRGRTDAGELVQLSYPLYVSVEEVDDVQVSIASSETVLGGDTPVNVTVANGDSEAISNVELGLSADSGTVTDGRKVSASIGANSDRQYTYSVTFDETGEQTLDAELTYTTADGYERTIRDSVSIDVETLTDDVSLTANTETRDGANVLVTTLTNFGNLPIQDVQIRAQAEGQVIDREAISSLEPFSSTVVELDVSGVPPGEGEGVVIYEVGETEQTLTQPLTFDSEPEAEIVLTGVEILQSGNTLTLRGDASNVGESDAGGVLVSVVPNKGITPISPSKKYFVGGVDGSEFGTFELTAQTTGNVSSIPVSVEYTDDGDRVSQIVDLDLASSSATAQANNRGAEEPTNQQGARSPFSMLNEIPWALIGIGLVGISAVIGGVFLWRRNEQ